MRLTLSLIRREFSAYFYSPIAYVVLAVFLAVTGHLFYLTLDQLTETGPRGIAYPMELMVGNVSFWLVYLFIPPLLTMRLFAEERSTGTLEVLLTAPVRDWQVVFAKYVACFGFYTMMWLPTLMYLPILTDSCFISVPCSLEPPWIVSSYAFGAVALLVVASLSVFFLVLSLRSPDVMAAFASLMVFLFCVAVGVLLCWPIATEREWWVITWRIDPWPIVTTYLGLAFAGAMFLAIGLFVSSLVTSQMIAAIVSLFIGLLFILGGIWQPEMDTSDMTYKLFFFFSVPGHFSQHFARGMIDTRHLALYGSVTLYGLFLTVRSLEGRRWR
jgi:ABC-2 type transport system permease protein